MAELPPPADSPPPILVGSPRNHSLPLRPVESLHISEMGTHTPGKNSDALFIARHHQHGKPLALICDGLTGGVRERASHSGAWTAEKLVTSLSTSFDLYHPLSRGRILSLLSAEDPRGAPLYARCLLGTMSNEAIDRCVTEFFEGHLFAPGKLLTDPLLIDKGAGETAMTRYRQRYLSSGRILESIIEFDAVISALRNDQDGAFEPLTNVPSFRLALAIVDALEPFRAEFNQTFRPSLVEYGGSTIVGAVEDVDSLILFNAGDSRACIIGPQGIHHASLTPCHQSCEGKLTSFAGIDGIPMHVPLILPEQLSAIRIAKSEIPPNSYLVLWSDGYYLDFAFERFQQLVGQSPLSAAQILAAMESCHEHVATAARYRNRKFSVDDRTGIVIKL